MSKAERHAKLDPIHHVAVVVRDVGESVRWYTERFRCVVVYCDATWALLQFGNLQMALVSPGQHAAHVGIAREDAPRFGAIRAHRDGVRYVYIEDPSGNTVEVVEEKEQRGRAKGKEE
jgi:catechol 2,3-dioxygenase-like lactoylglutathione lyase family enzyme